MSDYSVFDLSGGQAPFFLLQHFQMAIVRTDMKMYNAIEVDGKWRVTKTKDDETFIESLFGKGMSAQSRAQDFAAAMNEAFDEGLQVGLKRLSDYQHMNAR